MQGQFYAAYLTQIDIQFGLFTEQITGAVCLFDTTQTDIVFVIVL